MTTQIEKRTMTVEETADALGIGRNLAYKMVGEGTIPSLKLGRRIVVPISRLTRLLDNTQIFKEEKSIEIKAIKS